MKLFFLTLAVIVCVRTEGQDKQNQIIIESEISALSQFAGKDTTDLTTLHVFFWGDSTRTNDTYLKPELAGNKFRWTITTRKPLLVTGRLLETTFLCNPGDNIKISLEDNNINFSGKGASKYQLLYELERAKKLVPKPKQYVVDVENMDEYLIADNYYDQQLAKVIPIINLYSTRINIQDWNWIKSWTIEWIEYKRLRAFFNAAYKNARDTTQSVNPKYSLTAVRAIWDSTQFRPLAKWLRNQHNYNNLGGPLYFYNFNRTEVWLKYNFDLNNETLGSKPIRTYLYYEGIKRNYKGLLRERVLNFLLDEQVIMEMGVYHKMTKTILKDYYALPGFASYKNWIKQLEKKRTGAFWKDNWAPPFELTDVNGNIFTKDRLKDKLGVIDFWFTGCKGCIQMTEVMKKVEEPYSKDTNVVFLSVSIDNDKKKWLKSIDEKKYTTGKGIQLFTGDKGFSHPMIKQYEIRSFPSLVLIDSYGRLINSEPPFDARDDDGEQLSDLIQQQLIRLKDGPYVLYGDHTVQAYTISAGVVKQEEISGPIKVATDKHDRVLNIKLQKTFSSPPAEYEQPNNLLIFSDIEGNFSALRKLLMANNVIDSNFNWTFGSGHLVLAGDIFDRGEQVVECLWLIYSLEEKAAAKGGYVHFILGNHELMNLQGNYRYTMQKYKNNALLLNKTIRELYGENSELGRWLRSKNIVEKVGDLLILHAGISSELNNLSLSVSQINELSRPYFANDSQNFTDKRLNTLLSYDVGPFWYRGYYKNGLNKASLGQVDSTLRKFDVTHIITGHTIVADTVSVHYNGKIINTDTNHAAGKSEALLIEGSNFYRVNDKGQRRLLFVTTKRQDVTVKTN